MISTEVVSEISNSIKNANFVPDKEENYEKD